jgi:multidrug resistance efflux pump
MKKKLLLILIPLVILVGFFLIRKSRASSSSFAVQSVSLGQMDVSTSASGEIRAEKDTTLTFQTLGLLSWIGFKKGDSVKKGQAVAALDKRDLEKRFKKEMNDYLTTRWDFEQTQDDYKETKDNFLVTDEIKRILDQNQFTLDNSVLDVEIAD